MSAFPLVVIGIGVDDAIEGYSVGNETPTKDKAAAAQAWTQTFTQTLGGIMPATSAFPLVKRLVLVPSQVPVSDPRSPARGTPRASAVGTPRGSVAGNGSPGSGFIRYAPAEGGDSWAAKLLGEVIGDVYAELGELVSSCIRHELTPGLIPRVSGRHEDAVDHAPPFPFHPPRAELDAALLHTVSDTRAG
jgi:hypothetical protein